MTTFGINPFVLRQVASSPFTHFEGEFEELKKMLAENFHLAKPGYREGVCLVPVAGDRFFCGVVTLKEGDQLVGEYKARRPGEEPRKTTRVVGGTKSPCSHVDLVLYSKEVLAEGDEERTGSDWDLIAINGRTTEEEMPIAPMTLIANHFVLDGGTATGMSPEEFESALRESVLFWKDKALIFPE